MSSAPAFVRRWFLAAGLVIGLGGLLAAQIPMDRVLSRLTVPSTNDTRGLVDVVGFPQTAAQMDVIGKMVEELELDQVKENQQRFGFDASTRFVAGWCPHDDYILAARVYAHVQRYTKARTILLVGNSHWAQTFGIKGRLIFDDFKYWRGPYAPVKVSSVREEVLAGLSPDSYVVQRKVVETEHSLEALIPYLQFYNRDVEIVPILVPLMTWDDIQTRGQELARVVASIVAKKGWVLGRDLAVLASGDGQHYGDYGWSYYDFHPFGCDADGYKQSVALDETLINGHLTGELNSERLKELFTELVDQHDITKYKVTWCGRFAVPFGLNFAGLLTRQVEGRSLTGYSLRRGTSISFPWLPIQDMKLGLTGDANLHHFVTYAAVGYK